MPQKKKLLKGELLALEQCGRRLLLVRAVGWIVGGFDFREAPHAGSVDLGDGVLERLTLDIFLDRPVFDLPLQADELPLLERLGQRVAPAITFAGPAESEPIHSCARC